VTGEPTAAIGCSRMKVHAVTLGLRDAAVSGFEARHDEPSRCAARLDQLLCRQPRTGTQVSEVALHGARANPDEVGGVLNGSTGDDERWSTSFWR
jgi:hypothetical protein